MRAVPIGGVVRAVGKWDPRKEARGPITYLDLSSVDQGSKEITEPSTVDGPEAPSRARQLVSAGDVLVSTVRPNLNAVAHVPPGLDGATASTGFCVLRPTPGEIDGRYLFHWVRTSAFIGRMVQLSTGASYPAVSDKIVKSSEIPLPSIEEQRRIAAVLDAADALRAKRRQALAKLDTLTQAIFIDMFGDPSKASELWPLSDQAAVVTKGTTPTSVGYEFTSAGVPFVRVQDLVGGTVDWRKIDLFVTSETSAALGRSILRPGDVLISIAGTIGRTAIVPDDAPELNCNQAVALVRTSPSLDAEFLRAWLCTDHALAQMSGSRVTGTISNLSLTRIKELRLPVPSLDLQAEFVKRVREAKARVVLPLVRSGAMLDALFLSLRQRAFRGEL